MRSHCASVNYMSVNHSQKDSFYLNIHIKIAFIQAQAGGADVLSLIYKQGIFIIFSSLFAL